MTNAIYVKAPSQNHKTNNNTTTILTCTNTNSLILRRAKFGHHLHSSSPNDVLSPLLIHRKNYSTTTTTTSSSGGSNPSTTSSSPRLSFYDKDDDDNNNPVVATSPPMSPFNNQGWLLSPTNNYLPSPWTWIHSISKHHETTRRKNHSGSGDVCYSRGSGCLIGSLVREEGHVHSLAVRSGVLYTGSESNNIRIWRHFKDAGSLKSGSGFVKAILVSSPYHSTHGHLSRVFTGHNDGKIRVWTHEGKRVGTFPKLTDFIKTTVNPKSYVDPRKHRKVVLVQHIKHYDAVSCLGLNEEAGLLYSGSWDKTIKVWRVKDGKCVESINAHVDAINSIVVGFNGLVFSGSADGTLKMWRKDSSTCNTRHVQVRTLIEQEDAVTSLAVAEGGGGWPGVLYCGSSDGLVNFWEREINEEVVFGGVLRGHKLAVLCLATAGCLVFSGSADKSICVWRREMGEDGVHSCLAVLSGHSGPVKCLAVERDRDHDEKDDGDDDDQRRKWIVYSGSLDKSVRIWRVSEHTPDDTT